MEGTSVSRLRSLDRHYPPDPCMRSSQTLEMASTNLPTVASLVLYLLRPTTALQAARTRTKRATSCSYRAVAFLTTSRTRLTSISCLDDRMYL